MKRAHRRTHFAIWAILGPLMLWLLFLAVQNRPTEPVNTDLPDVLIEEAN